jgi:biopolymer transport protein ExbD
MSRKIRRMMGGETEEMNLVPFMAVLCILIPMLLLMFSFTEVTAQSVESPKIPSRVSPTPPTEKPLNLTVLLTDKGFLIKYDEDRMAQSEEPIDKRTMPADANHPGEYAEYDFPRLHNRLVELKGRFPGQEILNIAAEYHIPWRHIARTIDCARLRLKGAPFHTFEAYETARAVVDRQGVAQTLFPHVRFAVAE